MPKAAPAREAAQTIVEEVRAYCRANADAERAGKWSRYFTEGYDAYGLDYKDPSWDENGRRWAEMAAKAGANALFEAGGILFSSGKYEEGSFAIIMARQLPQFRTAETFARFGKWFEGGIRNWGHTDVLCADVLAHFIIDDIVPVEAVASWVESPWKFQRRAAPVMLIPAIKVSGDPARFLDVLEPLMSDVEKVVQQGTGWFLRECWKRHPGPTEAFLLRHKETAPRVIVQYATEKMSAADKARFKRST